MRIKRATLLLVQELPGEDHVCGCYLSLRSSTGQHFPQSNFYMKKVSHEQANCIFSIFLKAYFL